MVTCTITPSRAAARLNSGVRPSTVEVSLKGIGSILIPLFFLVISSLPFMLLDARNMAGKFIRANSFLIAMIIFWYAEENMGKKPSMILFSLGAVFVFAFIKQVFQRRGLPILESLAGIAIFKASLAVTDSYLVSTSIASISVLMIALMSSQKFPIRSHHSDA